MHKKRIAGIIVAALALWACVVPVAAREVHESSLLKRASSPDMEAWVDSVFATLTPEQRVAQMMVVTLQPTVDAPTKKSIDRHFSELKVGGVLFSQGECEAEAELINYVQQQSAVPAMVTLDGEWGMAMRLSDTPSFPRNMVLGAITNDRLLYEYGREMARECKLMGVHVNFAPVLDVNDNPDNPVIGSRSFGEMAERVASHGVAYARGMEDNGVLTTAKHFPGHGSTADDSHHTLPRLNKTIRELNLCEMVPFKHYVEAGLSGIMVGHLAVPKIDDSGMPASLSPDIQSLLHSRLGFTGLVFTDALVMNGARTQGSVAVKAILAGNDVLLSPANAEKEIEAVMRAVRENKISMNVIDERCKKILRYKYALGLNEQKPVDVANVKNQLNGGESAAMINRLWAGAMTVISNHDHTLPVRHLEEKKIAVVTLGDDNAKNTMFQRRCASYTRIHAYSYKSGDNAASLVNQLREGDYQMVIVAVHSPAQVYRAMLATLTSKLQNVSVAMFVDPYKVKHFAYALKHCRSVLMAYDNNSIAQDYAAQAIFGGIDVSGELPVSIENVAKAGTGISYKATRLGYSRPEEAGLASSMLARIDSIAWTGLKHKAFSGLQVLVARHGKVVCNQCYGYTDFSKTRKPVDENTLFDLASVAKVAGTLPGIMKCVDQGKLHLDDKASKYITELRETDKEDITFNDLLLHESGMPATLNMYYVMSAPGSYKGRLLTSRRTKTNSIKIHNKLFANKTARLRSDVVSKTQSDEFNMPIANNLFGSEALIDTVMSRIYNVKLRRSKSTLYSCLNFCLLMDAEQRITKTPHEQYVSHYFFEPLGAYNTCYRPAQNGMLDNVVATENDTFLRRQTIKGYVHDEMAAFLGGVSGNAGLFSTSNDLAKICQMWLNGGEYGGTRLLKESTVNTFLETKASDSRRGLGFDKPDKEKPRLSPCCKAAPAEVVGHTGFTGTCLWVDPVNDMIYIFLSNRVHPTRDNSSFKTLNARKTIQAIIYESIIAQ
ncbi:MAG: glycoside hydrolase family 3 N-terminal domain-containing protein [Muribaculaceae bacterium]